MRNLIIGISILVIGIIILNNQNELFLNKCQEEHSFDTCFSTLNR